MQPDRREVCAFRRRNSNCFVAHIDLASRSSWGISQRLRRSSGSVASFVPQQTKRLGMTVLPIRTRARLLSSDCRPRLSAEQITGSTGRRPLPAIDAVSPGRSSYVSGLDDRDLRSGQANVKGTADNRLVPFVGGAAGAWHMKPALPANRSLEGTERLRKFFGSIAPPFVPQQTKCCKNLTRFPDTRQEFSREFP